MKILLIHNFYQHWGGEDMYVTSLKKLLEERGNRVYLYAKDSKNIKTFWDKIKAAIGLFYNPWVKRELDTIIKEFKPDIAHFHNVYPLISPTAYWVCKKNKIKIIQHIHNYRFMCPKGILFRAGKICELCLHKKFPFYSIFFGCYHRSRIASLFFSLAFFFHNAIGTFKLIDKFIFPSEFTRDYYIKHLKIDVKKTYFLPYFVDIPKKLPKIKIKEKDFFLYIGRLSEEKGIIELLEVFRTLPKLKLIVIGDGPLRRKIKEYKKYSNITILGFLSRDKISEYIQESKAIIISSIWYEVLPFVYLEALSNNTPVFVPRNNNFTLTGGVVYNLTLFYKFADFNDLKKKIIRLSRKQIIVERVHNLFTSIYHYENLMNEYQKAI